MNLGHYLKQQREQAGIGLRELATRLDISPALISRVESGGLPGCSEDKLVRWSEALGCDPDYVLAVGGRIRQEIVDQVVQNPGEWSELLKTLRGVGPRKIALVTQRAARVVKDGKW